MQSTLISALIKIIDIISNGKQQQGFLEKLLRKQIHSNYGQMWLEI